MAPPAEPGSDGMPREVEPPQGCDPDAELVRRLRHGDPLALALLAHRWEKPTFRLAYRISGNRAEAEEIRQIVFLRLLENPTALRQPDRFAAWIRRTTVNTAINALRRTRRRADIRPDLHAIRSPAGQADPSDVLAAADEAERLAVALKQLRPSDRALLALRFEEDLTFQEIADATQRPVGTVKSRVQQATRILRRLLSDDRPVRRDQT